MTPKSEQFSIVEDALDTMPALDVAAADLDLLVGLESQAGPVRQLNEDFANCILPRDDSKRRSKGAIFVVADGMGGHQAGEVASRTAVDVVVREYLASSARDPLLVVGGANYESAYLEVLKATEDPRVRFLGPVYEPEHIEALFLGAKAYIHGHEVGGTNPSLVTAMGCGRLVLAHAVPFNREVLGGNGLLWTKAPGSLRACIEEVEIDSTALGARAAVACRQRIRDCYAWDKCARDHDRFFRWLAGEVEDYADSF